MIVLKNRKGFIFSIWLSVYPPRFSQSQQDPENPVNPVEKTYV